MLSNHLRLFFSSNKILLLIVVIGALLRLLFLSTIPDSLNVDELAIGYNAYSIMLTGTDEHGKFPLALESFGDWKLPLYPLITIVPVFLVGLNEFSVRLPSAIAGIGDIYVLYLLTYQLFKNKNLSLIVAFFCCISPWNIYFSRMAYEDNVATFFFLTGLLLFLKYLANKRNLLFFLSMSLFGLTLFTYHAYVIFMPIFVTVLLTYYRQSIRKRLSTILAVCVFIVFFSVSFYSSLTTSFSKIDSLSVFTSKNINPFLMNLRADYNNEDPHIKSIMYNRLTIGTYQFAQNYVDSFSPNFLFYQGGEKVVDNLGFFGNLYLFDAVLLVIGIFFLIFYREKASVLLLIWVLTAPIASALTVDSPNTTRLYMLFPLFVIVEAYGVYKFILYCLTIEYKGYVLFGAVLGIFLLNVLYFMEGYFLHINIQRSEFLHYGYKQAVTVANSYPKDKIVMAGPGNFPYISFLFYNKFDPKKFQRGVQYYTQIGDFHLVRSFDRYTFPQYIDYNHLQSNTLYIIGGDKPKGYGAKPIQLPNGRTVLWYFTKS